MNPPVSSDQKIQLLTELLSSYLEKTEVEFCIEENDLFYPEVVGHFGCLPLILLDAKENYEKIFNQDLKIEDFGDAFKSKITDELKEQFTIEDKPRAKTFGIDFITDEQAFFDAIPVVAGGSSAVSFVVLAHFAHYSLEEYIAYFMKNKHLLKNGKIPLDNLYLKWKNAVLGNKIEIKPAPTTVVPSSGRVGA